MLAKMEITSKGLTLKWLLSPMFAKSAQLKIATTPANGIMLDSNVIAVPHLLKCHFKNRDRPIARMLNILCWTVIMCVLVPISVSEKHKLLKTISGLWPGLTVQWGSAARDYRMQCDRSSHLLRVKQGGGCHCYWLCNQLLTWCMTSDLQIKFLWPAELNCTGLLRGQQLKLGEEKPRR